MKKVISSIVVLCMVFSLAGCVSNVHSSKAFTFNVETGDAIKVSLNTLDDYDLSSDLPFVVSCGDESLSYGTFIFGDAYNDYVDVVDTDVDATLIDSGEKDGNEYIFWSYNDSEYNYAILVDDSNTGIILSNTTSEESAKECFDRLTFSVDN